LREDRGADVAREATHQNPSQTHNQNKKTMRRLERFKRCRQHRVMNNRLLVRLSTRTELRLPPSNERPHESRSQATKVTPAPFPPVGRSAWEVEVR